MGLSWGYDRDSLKIVILTSKTEINQSRMHQHILDQTGGDFAIETCGFNGVVMGIYICIYILYVHR